MDENSVTTEDRAVLRTVAAYTDSVTAADAARMLGTSRQLTASVMAELARRGLLSTWRRDGRAAYTVTPAGTAELERNVTTCLLVEVDDRLAADILAYLNGSVNGVKMAYEHGNGCCCQHCPHKGNCR